MNNLGFLVEKINLFPKKEYYYESSLENLQSLNRFFLLFENSEQVKLSLIKMANEKNITIIEENDKCKINIKNQINNTQFSININLKTKDIKSEMENIILEIIESKEKNENLEKRVIYLEEYIKKLEEEKKNKNNLNNIFNNINEDDASLIISWLPNKPLKFELLFDTKKDGDYSSTFHNKCEGKYPTLIIIKSNTGYIFGGYVTSA